jgi:hypothetical protein
MGSTFTFRLPEYRAEAAAQPSASAVPERAAGRG